MGTPLAPRRAKRTHLPYRLRIRHSSGSAYTCASLRTSLPSSTYRKHLFWKSKDSVHGSKEGEDNYSAIRIGASVFFVNWVESDGTTVSQVLDLKERTCQAFLTSHIYSGRDVNRGTVTLSGKITRIEDSNHLLLD